MRALGNYLQAKVLVCVGGTSIHDDQCIVVSGVRVASGTSGCVFDMLCRHSHCPDYNEMHLNSSMRL